MLERKLRIRRTDWIDLQDQDTLWNKWGVSAKRRTDKPDPRKIHHHWPTIWRYELACFLDTDQ